MRARTLSVTVALALATSPVVQASSVTSTWSGSTSTNWSTPANWSPPAAFPNNGNAGVTDYNVIINKTTSPNFDPIADVSVSIDALTLNSGANLTINNGTTFTLAGTSLANAGLLTLNANTTATGHLTLALSPLSTTTLSGGGTILMNLLSASITGAGLTNLDNTIEGSGNISIPMTNKGTIHALDHSFGLWNFGPQPSPLYLNAPIDNTDGSIIIDPMGEIFSNSTITGGTLTTSAGAYLHGNGTLANITLTTGSVLGLDGTNITPHFAGTFTNHGTILVGDTSGSPAFSLAGNTTLTGGGTVILSNVYYSKIIGNFTNLDNTIRGQGNITSTLTNQSTIRAEGGRLSLASINNLGGTLSAAANATLAPNALVSGGNISLDPGSALQGNGTLQNVTLTSGSTWILGPMLNIGTSGYYPMPEGTFTNHGNIVISQYGADSTLTFAPTANTVLNGAGTITLTNATLAHISGGNFTNVDNTIQGTGIISANLTNQSAINATGGNLTFTGIVDNSAGTINIAGNASLLVNGLLSGGNISLSPGSQIGGNGFLDAPTLSGNGTLAVSPFSDASRLSNLTVTPLSSLTIKSNARFGGTLANHGTLTLSPNSSFNLLISANTTLTGGGTLILSNSSVTGGNLINLDNTIQGSGTFTSNLTNHGTLIASGGNLTFGSFGPSVTGTGNVIIAPAAAITAGNFTQSSLQNDGAFTLFGTGLLTLVAGNGSLSISANAHLTLAPDSPTSHQSDLTASTLHALDLTNNKLIIDPVSKSTTFAKLQSELAAGNIFSSTLPPNAVLLLLDNAINQLTTFGGTPVTANSLLLTIALPGDTNLDNKIDLTDLSTVLNHFGQSTSAWTSGNFDHAPTIDLTDLSALLNNFGQSNPIASSQLAVTNDQLPQIPTPEPASLALLLPASPLLRRKR